MKNILFLDCDGTIRQPKSGAKFISSPFDQQIIPGADVGIDYHHKLGYIIIGITNQAGVAAGHKSLDDAIAEQRHTLELFPHIEAIYFCPDFEGRDAWKITSTDSSMQFENPFYSSYRKPGCGMILWAIKEIEKQHKTQINIAHCEMVGDRPEDEACAAAAGISFTSADLWVNCYRALEKEYKETGDIS